MLEDSENWTTSHHKYFHEMENSDSKYIKNDEDNLTASELISLSHSKIKHNQKKIVHTIQTRLFAASRKMIALFRQI